MVSVIIPTYNRAAFVREAVVSVLEQDWLKKPGADRHLEVVVVDDGSEDETGRVLASFGNRVRYHGQEHRGVSAARNTGLRLAGGELIAFLDSDDLWLKEKLNLQLTYMEAFPRAMVCITEEIWQRDGIRLNPGKRHRKPQGRAFERMLRLCLLSFSTALFRREIFDEIGNFDEDLPACEDYDFGLRLSHRYPFHLLKSPLVVKRGGHAGQLSRAWGLDRYRVQALLKALDMDLTKEEEGLVRDEVVAKCRVLIKGFLKRGKSGDANTYQKIMELYGS